MLDCLVLGDSIAAGTAHYRPECASLAKVGITSQQWNQRYAGLDLRARNVVISLGTNDHKYIQTRHELERLRYKVGRANVFWILPAGISPRSGISVQQLQYAILEVARGFGDRVIPIVSIDKDRIHPTAKGYKDLAQKTKRASLQK